MIKDIIKRDLSVPKLNDSAINILAVMEEHKISHVPVVDENNKFIGLIDELSIINMNNIQHPLSSMKKNMKNIFLVENAHIFQSIQTVTSHLLSIIPIVDENHIGASIKFRELVTTYSENKDLLMMGGYTQGQDPVLDQAIAAWPKITEFIKQKESKKEDFNSSSSQLMQMFGG